MTCLACDDGFMLDDVEIREATSADAPAIAALVEQYWSFEEIPGFQFDRVKRLLEECLADARVARAWMASSNGEVCGYLLAVLVFLPLFLLLFKRARPFAVVTTLQLGFLFYVYFSAPVDTRYYVISSFPRLSLQLIPAVLAVALGLLGARAEGGDPKSFDRSDPAPG